MYLRTVLLATLGATLAFWLSPNLISEAGLEGRLIEAPAFYVRQKLFDANFVQSLVQQSGKDDFFYPLRLREQGERTRNSKQSDLEYAKEIAEMHAGFKSEVRVQSDSVLHIALQEGTAWRGQKTIHSFTLSEMEGKNGTATIFEYERTWKASALVKFLSLMQEEGEMEGWVEPRQDLRIDSKMLDLFWHAVEDAWPKEIAAYVAGEKGRAHMSRV